VNIYWVGLTINFNKPISVFEDELSDSKCFAYGFFQEIGCTGDNEEKMKDMIIEHLSQFPWLDMLQSGVSFDRIGLISMEEVQSEIYGDPDVKDSLISDPLLKGIWYLSGKAFFSDEIHDNEFHQVEVVRGKNRKTQDIPPISYPPQQ